MVVYELHMHAWRDATVEGDIENSLDKHAEQTVACLGGALCPLKDYTVDIWKAGSFVQAHTDLPFRSIASHDHLIWDRQFVTSQYASHDGAWQYHLLMQLWPLRKLGSETFVKVHETKQRWSWTAVFRQQSSQDCSDQSLNDFSQVIDANGSIDICAAVLGQCSVCDGSNDVLHW